MKTIGIDLGTTNSCVYFLSEESKPVLAMMGGKYKIFPSVAWAAGAGTEVIIGHAAKTRMGQQPAPVVAIKRKMGTTETVLLAGAHVSAVDVSAAILSYIRRQIEEITKDKIGAVVITVPAYFNSAPKNDTYLAAVKAFFDGDAALAEGRIELQLEPEAAAYAYASEDRTESMRILVYDFGGGTFDVTILAKSRDAGLNVVKFGGDPHLGGDNVDDRIAAWFLYLVRGGDPTALDRLLNGKYPSEKMYTLLQQILVNDTAAEPELLAEDRRLLVGAHSKYALDLDSRNSADLSRVQVLKRLAESAKIELTTSPVAVIAKQGAFEDQNGEIVDIDLTLERSDFDRLIGDLITSTMEATAHVLKESGTSANSIDKILLVGGSSRMLAVREELGKLFPGKPILLADPDLIVARGAAIRAAALTPPPIGVRAGEAALVLHYPRETAEEKVDVRGDLGKPAKGHAYLLANGSEVGDSPVAEGKFRFRDVCLSPNQENRFRVEVLDQGEETLGEADFSIRHDENSFSIGDRVAPKVTRPIRALGVKGYHALFTEGESLPKTKPFVCYRATQDDHIDIEFYEGERPLATLHIPQVDPRLQVGAAIDLEITVNATYAVSAVATIRDTKQSAVVQFEISRLQIPSLEVMDYDLKSTLEQIENDLEMVRDPNRRATLYNRMRRLAAEYTMARKALNKDMHKLYSTIAELRTMLIEVRTAQSLLSPPIEEFQGLAAITRNLAGQLPNTGVTPKQSVLDRIVTLERVGKEAWDNDDASEYKLINNQMKKMHGEIQQAILEAAGGRPRPPDSPHDLRRRIIDGLAQIRSKAESNHLLPQFVDELDAVQTAVRNQDLSNEDEALRALRNLIDTKVRPLDNRIEQAIESVSKPSSRSAKVSF